MTEKSGSSVRGNAKLMNKLEAIRMSVPKDMAIRVGVLGDEAARTDEGDSGMSNAEIGIIQEYGSMTKNIPARSWLLMPIERNINNIAAYMGSKQIFEMIMQGQAKKAFSIVGAYAEKWIQSAFSSKGFGLWKPNAPMTIAMKGSSSPLIDTGQLRRSVSSEVVNG